MLGTRKLLLSLAAAVILIGGYAYADQVVDEPAVHMVKVDQEQPMAVSGRVVPAVHHIRTLKDYETKPARSDMRVASAGLVFDRVTRSPPSSTWL
ncbi:hypothetical protein [Pseudomonas sp. SO81]|uniref:hypothetical protein n=1 Tax=Pseudomonas sp. SO81 TaxID=2983246 RepID=UPI0025A3E0E3|nr:hypothetical protein [Pseudomonas sp. SO81]WJN61352.1 hypothetical protein OH686_21625 [Pseudomonas sp. SO81]